MAEIFGTVASALSIAALFNNCVDCFEYIQLGRHFGRDYQRCQLKLDVAKTRLMRWGQAVQIDVDSRFATNSPSDQPVQLAQSILEEIVELFQAASKTSKRYEMTAKPQDLARHDEGDMNPTFGGLHRRLRDLARHRQKRTSLFKKTAWALYDGKSFERTIDQITGFIDDLEKQFPVDVACRQLDEVEIQEIQVEDESSLSALKDAADGTDMVLLDAVVKKEMEIAGRNSAKEVKAGNSADVQIGHQYSETVVVRGVAVSDKTFNSAGTVDARDKAKVQIGSRFGMRF